MKKEKIIYKYVLAIDIGGATRMGVALYDNENKKLLQYDTIKRSDSKTNLEHRLKLVQLIKEYISKYSINIMLFESIRLFSYGHIQLSTILSLNKVQTTLINEFSDCFDIFQVDVRSWKAKVLGSAKSDKYDALKYVNKHYPNIDLIDRIIKPRKKEIILELNHDLADSICISQCLKYDYDVLKDKNKLNYS